jgi:hypothetical protein
VKNGCGRVGRRDQQKKEGNTGHLETSDSDFRAVVSVNDTRLWVSENISFLLYPNFCTKINLHFGPSYVLQ